MNHFSLVVIIDSGEGGLVTVNFLFTFLGGYMKKKFVTTLVALVSAVSVFATPVCAAETSTPVEEETVERQSVGSLLAGGGKTIYGGSATLTLYLSSANWWTDIMCGTTASGASGSVSCYVTNPKGSTKYLGTISTNADHTDYMEFSYCPAGTYTFTFESNTSDTFDVYARMYD